MAFSEKNLTRKSIGDTAETIYTSVGGKIAVKDIHFCNNTNVDCHISLWMVGLGDSNTNENVMFKEWNIPANDFAHWDGFQVLETIGDFIVAQSETAGSITITISGAEIS